MAGSEGGLRPDSCQQNVREWLTSTIFLWISYLSGDCSTHLLHDDLYLRYLDRATAEPTEVFNANLIHPSDRDLWGSMQNCRSESSSEYAKFSTALQAFLQVYNGFRILC